MYPFVLAVLVHTATAPCLTEYLLASEKRPILQRFFGLPT
jgi:hypothetical protein